MSYPPSSPASRSSRFARSRPQSPPENGSTGSRSSADVYAAVPAGDGHDHAERLRSYQDEGRIPSSPGAGAGTDYADGFYPHNNNQAGTMSRGPSFYADPYGEGAYNSRANLSDVDSQRDLYRAGGMGSRRESNLAYGEKDDDEFALGAGAAGAGAAAAGYGATEGKRGGPRSGRQFASTPSGKGWWGRRSTAAKRWIILALLVLLAVIAVAVAVPVSMKSKDTNSNAAGAATQGGQTSAGGASSVHSAPKGVPTGTTAGVNWKTAAVGGDGSTVYMEDGTTFLYNNTFGGFWNAIPFNDTAQPQSDVPALNQPWDYNANLIQGVNLGGWLVIEPFIVPGLFEPFNAPHNDLTGTNNAVDEWTLSVALGSNLATVVENHYKTFITEKDFAEIAGAGLNWIRLPIPYWAIEVYEGEPFLANVAWTYFLKAIVWARKYGLRINLDLHAVPGSQNGYNHSSKLGTINFLNGVMGIANAQRTLNYIRTLTEFISQPQYKNVFPMFSILNEPYAATIGINGLMSFSLEAYNIMRDITGVGAGNGPYVVLHDGFVKQATSMADGGWNGFLTGSDRIAIDSHPYLCFSVPNNDGLSYQAAKPCSYWANPFNVSTNDFGLSMGGEWSLAINDCGKWVNNVGNGQRYDGTYYIPGNRTAPQYSSVGSCDPWNNWSTWSDDTKAGLKLVANGHMDALRHWFFWTWKTGYSTELGTIANPLWNYQLALEQGFMPTNPRSSLGSCPVLVAQNDVKMPIESAPALSAWMTGGAGAGTIVPTSQLTAYAWPPATLGTLAGTLAVAPLPTYTASGSIITMPVATPTSYPAGFSSAADPGDGWLQPTDTASFFTPVQGCSYLNPWSGAGAAAPAQTVACTGAAAADREKRIKRSPRVARPTPPPQL